MWLKWTLIHLVKRLFVSAFCNRCTKYSGSSYLSAYVSFCTLLYAALKSSVVVAFKADKHCLLVSTWFTLCGCFLTELILHQWQKVGKYVKRKFPIKQNNKQASNKTSATPLKTNQFEQKANMVSFSRLYLLQDCCIELNDTFVEPIYCKSRAATTESDGRKNIFKKKAF